MRKEIYEFAEELEKVMSENDAKKGDSYKTMSVEQHREGLEVEIKEWVGSYMTLDESINQKRKEIKELLNTGNRVWMLWSALKRETGGK